LFIFTFPCGFILSRSSLALSLGLMVLSSSALAQAVPPSPTLRQSLDAAWQISSLSRAASSRRSEFAAKEKAASSWISGEPVATIAHRTDLLTRNDGFREYEAELELPLWNRGMRSAALTDAVAQQQGFDGQLALAKLKLAGELRLLAAHAAIAQVELDLNQRKLQDANALALDLDRRVKAGENARVDGLQAQVLVQQAQTALAQADSQLRLLQHEWRGLTGLATVAALEEPLASQIADETAAAPVSPDHPALRYAQAQVHSAQARLALTSADKHDPMAIGVGLAHERGSFGAANDTKLRIALRIPLGGDNRNAPRLAAARAELDTAQAQADLQRMQLPTEVAGATVLLRAARLAHAAARERERLSTEIQALITKSWRLGNSDLPTRLRADNEQFEASLSLARANVDVQRAIANLNQAYGYLP
jgi:outer membrane protein, heavy metal efflux system